MFFITLDVILFIFLVNECARTKYPKLHNDFFINLVYYSVYIYSTAEGLYNKIPQLFIIDDIVINDLELILDNDGNYITDTEEFIIDQNVPEEYLFAVYTQLNDNKTVRKRRIYRKVPNDCLYDCDETSYKFILIEVKYGDSTIKLVFNDLKSTYYVVNNEFDSRVIHYLWRLEHGFELPEKYTICILDQNVNRFEFNETQVLRLNKDGYEVIDAYDTEIDSEIDSEVDSEVDSGIEVENEKKE